MKKVLVIILSVLLVFSLTACDNATKNTDSDANDISQTANTNSVVSEENKPNNTNKNSSSELTYSNDTNSNKNQSTQNNSSKSTVTGSNNESTQNNSSKNNAVTSSKSAVTSNNNQSTQNNSSKNNTATSSNNTVSNNTTSENIDNGVLKKATSQKMNVPENMKLLGTDNAKEENNSNTIKATVGLYQLDGDVVNWTTENDLIYVITSGNNRLVIINSKTMMAVTNIPLAGKPAEINLIGDRIYISLPDLCRIDIFSKSIL